MSAMDSIISVVLFPAIASFKLIQAAVLFLVWIIQHTVIVPLFVAFDLMVYTTFIKIPIIIPLKYLLELEDGENIQDLSWMKDQVLLFTTSALHFVIANVLIGLLVGYITGNWMRVVKLILLSKPKEKPKNSFAFKIKSEKTNEKSVQTTPFLNEFINSVTVADPLKKTHLAHTEDLLTPLKTTSTGTSSMLRENQLLRERLKNKKILVQDGLNLYEDDDGYNYTVGEEYAAGPLSPMNPGSFSSPDSTIPEESEDSPQESSQESPEGSPSPSKQGNKKYDSVFSRRLGENETLATSVGN